MEGYLGSFKMDIKDTPFAEHTPADWALHFIEKYGGIDGSHHKTWVLDQAARALHGAEVIIEQARWDNGETEWRINLGTSAKYEAWVDQMRGATVDGEREYDYDEGIAP